MARYDQCQLSELFVREVRVKESNPMRTLIRHSISALFMALIVLAAHANCSAATSPSSNIAPQDSKKVLYDTFSKGMAGDAAARKSAYEAGKEYLQKYPDEKDPRTKEIKEWITLYEADMSGGQVLNYIYRDKKYAEAFQLGKQVLLTDPENIRILTALGYAGMPAAATGGNDLTPDAIAYAKKAMQLIESGKAPSDWKPFAGRDETLAWLNYSLGVMVLRTMPNDAITYLGKAAQFEGAPKQDPRVYFYLANLYGQDIDKQRSDYKANFEGKTETAESKAALAKIGTVVDLIIDSYARAIAYTNVSPQLKQMFQQQEVDWTNKLTEFYKFRHDGSDAGLSEFIANIRSKPLPGQQGSTTLSPIAPR